MGLALLVLLPIISFLEHAPSLTLHNVCLVVSNMTQHNKILSVEVVEAPLAGNDANQQNVVSLYEIAGLFLSSVGRTSKLLLIQIKLSVRALHPHVGNNWQQVPEVK